MTDLTPEQSEAVRRLLAEARADQPMPAEVAARLHGVLAELAAERGESPVESPTLAPVVPIRRRWPAVLLAAAAVTVIAYGATEVVGPQSSDDAGTSADRSVAGGDDAGLAEDQESAPEAAVPSPTSATTRPPQDLGYGRDEDVINGVTDLIESGARVMDRVPASLPDVTPLSPAELSGEPERSGQRSESFDNAPKSFSRYSGTACGPLDPFPLSTAYAALYRDHAALVVVLPAIDGVHTVQVFDCQGVSPRLAVETVTIPVGQLPAGE